MHGEPTHNRQPLNPTAVWGHSSLAPKIIPVCGKGVRSTFVGPKRASTVFDPLEKSIGPFEMKLHIWTEEIILNRSTHPAGPNERRRSPNGVLPAAGAEIFFGPFFSKNCRFHSKCCEVYDKYPHQTEECGRPLDIHCAREARPDAYCPHGLAPHRLPTRDSPHA